MPVWATLVLVAIIVVWAGTILATWLSEARRRRKAAESFLNWMNQEREDHHA